MHLKIVVLIFKFTPECLRYSSLNKQEKIKKFYDFFSFPVTRLKLWGSGKKLLLCTYIEAKKNMAIKQNIFAYSALFFVQCKEEIVDESRVEKTNTKFMLFLGNFIAIKLS